MSDLAVKDAVPESEGSATPINSRAELDALRKRVVEQCSQEVNATLRRHGCSMQPIAQYVPDGSGTFKLAISVNVVAER